MSLTGNTFKFMCATMTLIMFFIAVPYQPVLAAMISTDSVIEIEKAQISREELRHLITRENVEKLLVAQGINPAEAKMRINSLTDAEAVAIADQIDELQAGGSAIGVIVGAALLVFLVLLVTDILGYTDVFPFVNSQR